jgi:pimeloyl-ACP methyl ester carboxylesterase
MPEVEVNGTRLFYREAGQGAPVLLIHGSGIDSDAWGPIFGDWRAHADDGAALLRTLEAVPATVAGWSGGALVAAEMAVRHPENVAALVVLEGAIGGARNLDFAAFRMIAATLARRRTRGSDAAMDGFMDWLCTFRDGESVWGEYPEEGKRAIRANAPAVWAEFAKPDRLRRAQLAGIGCPVVAAAGERTQPWFQRAARNLVERVPDAEYREIPGANHALAYTAPEATAAVIREAASLAGEAPVPAVS